MKKIFSCLLFLIVFCICAYTQDEKLSVPVSTQTVSADNVGENQESVDGGIDDNEKTYTESGAIVKTAEPETPYELNIPTTTALGISGDQVLNKLGVNTSSTTAVNVSSNTPNVTVVSSDTPKQKGIKEESNKNKDTKSAKKETDKTSKDKENKKDKNIL